MKKNILTLCAVAMASVGIMAQDSTKMAKKAQRTEQHAEAWAEKKADSLTNELGLSADQKTKVAALYLKHFQEYQQIKAGAQVQQDKMWPELKTILTPEQLQKFKADRKAKMGTH
jgi:hypothetical protein